MTSNLFLILLILVTTVLSSCISQEKDQEIKPTAVTVTISPTSSTSTPTITPTSTGITYKEQIKNHPPSPRNLTGEFKANYVELRWDTPEKVDIPHNYNDTIIHYNIYKGTREENIRYLISSTERTFLDSNISDSSQYIYEVTAVHEGDVESVPSEDVIVKK